MNTVGFLLVVLADLQNRAVRPFLEDLYVPTAVLVGTVSYRKILVHVVILYVLYILYLYQPCLEAWHGASRQQAGRMTVS